MASISLTDPVAATTVTAGLHAGNNAALRTAVNGGLDDTNIAAIGVANIDGKKLASGYTAYTPAWTSTGVAPVLNNGTITGTYTQIGKTIFGYLSLTMGAGTTYGNGSYSFSLPVASVDPGSVLGQAAITDVSASQIYIHATLLATATTVQLYSMAAPGVAITNAAPVTFAVGDVIVARFQYKVA